MFAWVVFVHCPKLLVGPMPMMSQSNIFCITQKAAVQPTMKDLSLSADKDLVKNNVR
jgi:hypothetical protein